MNAISMDSATWAGIGVVIGGFFGAIITFWVAEGIGFRQGVMLTQKHHETLVAQKHEPKQEPEPDSKEETPAEMLVPEENVEVGELVIA